jgi:ketosteroid isomerase-like protein
MPQGNVDARPGLEAFKQAYLVANEAFNRHDFNAAFLGFHPELEWHTVADVPGPKVLEGRDSVIEAFQRLLGEFPDWRVEPQEFIDADNAILVRNLATGMGRTSGVPIRQPFTQVWTFREGRPFLVREYLDQDEALAVAGLRA